MEDTEGKPGRRAVPLRGGQLSGGADASRDDDREVQPDHDSYDGLKPILETNRPSLEWF